MPADVQDMILKQLEDLQAHVVRLEAQLARMQEQMTTEHRELSERVARLEHWEKVYRAVLAAGGVIVGYLIREALGRWF